jgi:hypothetical protein
MKFISNCSHVINWDDIIKNIYELPGKVLTYSPSGNDLDLQWQAAGYKHYDPAIEWIQYWSGKDFDENIANIFGNFVGATPYYTFISRIRPGKFIPFHEDRMKDQDLIPGNPVRYTCFISKPTNGHLSLVEDRVVYNAQQGDIWKWPNPSAQHSGVNVADRDKFMFNFWGYE